MQEFFDELKKYMTDNNLKDDTLLKNLCDDIYICRRTFGTQFANMFCTARGNSQNHQRAYATTHLPESDNTHNLFRRQPPIYRSTNRINRQQYEDDEDLEHDVSDSTDTPYRTQTMTQVMRSVSKRVILEDENEENDEEETQVLY
jgi:hypothetical protein